MKQGTTMEHKLSALILTAVFILFLFLNGFVSVVDKDPTVSKVENRALKKCPEFSFTALYDGTLTQQFDDYYADTFPAREMWMKVNSSIKKVFAEVSGKNNVIIVTHKMNSDDEAGG
jgi:broad specificity phosphatase PhoE